MTDTPQPDQITQLTQIYRELGTIATTVSQFDKKLDDIKIELDHKLPAQPFLKIALALVMILSAWLSALTGLTYGKKASNMTFNVRERGAALDDNYMSDLTEKEVNKRVTTRNRNLGVLDGDSKRKPSGG